MIKFTAFRTQKPRQFNYIPRYYDPEAEAREQRRKEVLGIEEPAGGEYVPGNYIRSQMRSRIQGDSKARRKSAAPLRLMIVFCLVGVGLWIWAGNIVMLAGALMIGFVAWNILSRK